MAKLVTTMGGSLDEMLGEEKEISQKELSVIKRMREVYETHILEIKQLSAEHLESVKKDKRYLAIACAVLGMFIIGWLLVDLMVGSVGWFRY